MREIFLFIALSIFAFTLKAQTVNGVLIKDIDVEYVQIIGEFKPFRTKLMIRIDFGQKIKLFSSGDESFIKDKDGQVLDFNSMIDALNFMSKNGFEFVTAYVATIDTQNVYHYVLKNKKRTVKE